jgi:pantoate--beta-alanine ligase
MVRDLNFPLEVAVCPTVREPDGLAMSSRNQYLDAEERQAATVLYRALDAARAAFESGEGRADVLRRVVTETIFSEPLARVQYVSCSDPDTLEELEIINGSALLSLAVFIGQTRLIDNLVLEQA